MEETGRFVLREIATTHMSCPANTFSVGKHYCIPSGICFTPNCTPDHESIVCAELCSLHVVLRHTWIGGSASSEFSMRGARSDSININGYAEM